jgi:hypothetical protein
VKGFESSSVEIDHDYENELKSVLKVQLYKKFIQIDASAKKENELYFGSLAWSGYDNFTTLLNHQSCSVMCKFSLIPINISIDVQYYAIFIFCSFKMVLLIP